MTEYFYILTIKWNQGANDCNATRSGLADVADDQDQLSTYNALFAEACKHFGAPEGATSVSYYHLARREL